MTNINKAADLLYQRSKELLGVDSDAAHRACQEHAQALADAGLLLPDLPPVTKPKPGSPEWDAYVADWDAEPMWETPERHGFSAGHEDGSVNVYVFSDGHNVTDIDILTPEEAEALGLALLAAAQHAKEHHAS